MLVVEDDADVREILADVLIAHGYTVLTAEDGEVGLRTARGALRTRVIILDLMMPRMSGYEFLEARLADSALYEIPVIVLTADRSAGEKVAKLGAAMVLSKPPALEVLLESVAGFCSRRAPDP